MIIRVSLHSIHPDLYCLMSGSKELRQIVPHYILNFFYWLMSYIAVMTILLPFDFTIIVPFKIPNLCVCVKFSAEFTCIFFILRSVCSLTGGGAINQNDLSGMWSGEHKPHLSFFSSSSYYWSVTHIVTHIFLEFLIAVHRKSAVTKVRTGVIPFSLPEVLVPGCC